ncbi:MAG: ABC transporter ATP-binding protein [Burkholderiales bacterium]|nr:ABC transporter ATP-binding protein [Burkholderiales bacterium]
MPQVIEIDRLTKRYGRRLAVDDVSFTIAEHEVLGLLGPNGSGKSTVLRVLTGYLRPSGGSVRIAGLDVSKQSLAARRLVGYVPEDVPLYTTMEVDEFLLFMGNIKGLRRKALRESVDRAIERLSLQSVRNLAIAKLSRGFRQRVAIAQALLGEPALLVLDEPTNGLDPRQIIDIREMIRDLARTHTVLVTSHILGEIEKVANRVAILLDGKLLALESLDHRGDRRVRVRVQAATAEQVRAAVVSVPGTNLLRVEPVPSKPAEESPDPQFAVTLDLDEPGRTRELVVALVGAGAGVLELGPAASDLETRFLQLTGRTAAAPTP